MDKGDQLSERLAETTRFAQTLVGLPVDDAAARATEAGFTVEVLRPDGPPVTLELRTNRIRLHVDDNDRVVGTAAG